MTKYGLFQEWEWLDIRKSIIIIHYTTKLKEKALWSIINKFLQLSSAVLQVYARKQCADRAQKSMPV